MRLVVGQLLALIRRYPALVDGAFVIIGWVAAKLAADYAYELHWIPWEIPQAFSLTLIVLVFGAAYLYARSRPARQDGDPPADSTGPGQ
jgi:predicted tellurium resistance membrane protein TerC